MKTILIIEDDLDIQEMLQFFLEDQGYQVLAAENGIDGVTAFRKGNQDLIQLMVLVYSEKRNQI